MNDWKSPVPEAAGAMGAEEIRIRLRTEYGELRAEGLEYATMDLWSADGKVQCTIGAGDEAGALFLKLSQDQARAFSEALGEAADHAEESDDWHDIV